MRIFILFTIFSILFSCNIIENFDNQSNKINLNKLNNSYLAAKVWMNNNFNSKWIFNYKYYPNSEEHSNSNNMIRQLMMSRILWELSYDDNELKNNHKKNLNFIMKNWYKEDWDYWYVYYSNKSKLWANAMLLRVLVDSPYFDEYKKEAYNLANTIELLQKENWWFKAWYIEPDYDFDEDYLLNFYSGEAILAIIEFYNKVGDNKYLEIALKAQDYYLKEYVYNIDKNYYPAYVPWHTMSLNYLYKIKWDKKYSDAIFVLNDKLLEIQNKDNESIFYWRFYNPEFKKYWSPHSSSDSVYTEWLIYAYEIAQLENDKYHMKLYRDSINISYHNLFHLQNIDDINMSANVYWSIRYNEYINTIRVDTISHFMDATSKYLNLFN